MSESLKSYFDVILIERQWSWTLVAIIYLIIGFFIRSWFMHPLSSRMRTLDGLLRKQLRHAYSRHSMAGWLFFIIPLCLFIAIWRQDIFPIKVKDFFVLLIAGFCFMLSILFHVHAFGIAAVEVLNQHHAAEKERKLVEG